MTAYRTRNVAVMVGVAALAIAITAHHDALAQALDFFGQNELYGYRYSPPNLAPMRMLLIAASGMIGFGLGWLLSPQAAAFRRLVVAAISVGLGLVIILDNGIWGWGLTPLACIATFMIGIGYWARSAVERFMTPPKILGDSEWASEEEIAEAGLYRQDGLLLGYRTQLEGETALHYGGTLHGLLCARSRSGKGTSVIIPMLLTYDGSIVVIDPKGENAMITAEHRRRMGHEVHVFDPFSITGLNTSRYNPLDELHGGDIELVDQCMMLADAKIVPSEKEPFWTDAAKGATQGWLGEIVTSPEESRDRHLGRFRDLVMMDADNQQKLFARMASAPYPFVANVGRQFLHMDEKLRSNVLATIQSQTHFLESPSIRDSLSKSDFSFADLKKKKMTIYLVLPSDKLDSHGRVLRLLIQQALSINARNIEEQPDLPVLFILDEMPALGRLSMVQKAFGLMAGYGLRLFAVVQDLSQMKNIYGDGWETFISNAGVIQYFGSRDKFTADYFSSLCGVKTVWSLSAALGRTFSRSSSSGGSGASHSTSRSDSETATYSTLQQQLAYPDQLMRLDDGKQILFVENRNPIIANKVPWFENPELQTLGVNLHVKKPAPVTAE